MTAARPPAPRPDPRQSIQEQALAIQEQALALGFDAVGFAPADAPALIAAGERLMEFLRLGRHGGMGWLEAKAERRHHPNALWPEARSVVVVGLNYGPPADPFAALEHRSRGALSAYAQGSDYHDLVKKRLRVLARFVHERLGAEVKIFVDTAPVAEKPLAQAAGLGWQGKHTNLVSRGFGSWLFLGSLYTTLDLAPDTPETDHCGRCRACLDACPTAAFPAPYQLDARRCLAYLSIEHAGTIPRAFRAAMGNRIYGCDDCLAVCPWNKYASLAHEAALWPRPELTLPVLADLAALDDAAFRQVFAGTAVKRIGRDRLLRNVAIALGNSGGPEAADVLRRLLDDASALVRAMAVWGLSRHLSPSEFALLRQARLGSESDRSVQAEWREQSEIPA